MHHILSVKIQNYKYKKIDNKKKEDNINLYKILKINLNI